MRAHSMSFQSCIIKTARLPALGVLVFPCVCCHDTFNTAIYTYQLSEAPFKVYLVNCHYVNGLSNINYFVQPTQTPRTLLLTLI